LGFTQRQEAIQIGHLQGRQGKGRGARGENLRCIQRRPDIALQAKGRLQRGVKAIAARISGDFGNINIRNRVLG